jgi:hypothetical protein
MKCLLITIPLEEKAVESVYYLGANMRFSAEDIVTSCLLGELPDQLMDIEEGCFSLEICDLPKPETRGKVSFEIPTFEVMG